MGSKSRLLSSVLFVTREKQVRSKLLQLVENFVSSNNVIRKTSLFNRHQFTSRNRKIQHLKCFSNNNKNKSSNREALIKKMLTYLPLFVCGEIVRGFGRGSKELGIPTANYSLEVVKSLPDELQTGAYYGWASVDNGEVLKMVMSIGWNPFYNNEEKSLETHIFHEYDCDLYGHILKICIVGYLRPERNFNSLEELIAAIKKDKEDAQKLLESEENLKLKEAAFFKDPIKNVTN